MAKKKRSSSKSSTPRHSSSKARVSRELRWIVGIIVYLYLFVSVFSDSGSLVAWMHGFYLGLLGLVSPVIALYLLWFGLKKVLPKIIPARLATIAGSVLCTVLVAGLISGFNPDAAATEAGGSVGNALYNGLSLALGDIIARALLFLMVLVALGLTFNRALLPFVAKVSDDQEGEDDEAPMQNSVKVMGEIASETPEPVRKGLFGGRRPAVIKADAPKPTAVPVRQMATNWIYPALTLLKAIDEKPQAGNIKLRMELIQKTLRDFGIDVTMTDVRIGPTVSQYTLKPAEGVKLNAITARQDDLALALAAESLRVEAPIPGRGLVGVEIPNEKKAMVGLRDILKSSQFTSSLSKLTIALGRDAAGEPSVADLSKMPHILIAGSTGSGKSVSINTLLLSLLMNNSPDELRIILVDPKRVELTLYNGIPHLLAPVITEPKDTVKALSWCVREMERRYKILSTCGKRNITQYNEAPDLVEGRLPFIVVVVDELADLMMASAREVESKIVRLAQMSRAVGIHLVVATQRPSVDVITGLIKANIPSRIAFAVTSQIDSRTIIDSPGAEKLLGYGDMLFMTTEMGKPRRIQGVFCSEEEIAAVIAHIRSQEPNDRYNPAVLEEPSVSRFVEAGGLDDEEESLLRDAYDLVRKHKRASTSMLQTYMKLGYNKAKRIITAMEERGMIGPERGGKQREVYEIDIEGSGVDVSTNMASEVADFDENS